MSVCACLCVCACVCTHHTPINTQYISWICNALFQPVKHILLRAEFTVACWQNQSFQQSNPKLISSSPFYAFFTHSALCLYLSLSPDAFSECEEQADSEPCVAAWVLCRGHSLVRLANGAKDRLHLNDVIITDAASCNEEQGSEWDPQRRFLPG